MTMNQVHRSAVAQILAADTSIANHIQRPVFNTLAILLFGISLFVASTSNATPVPRVGTELQALQKCAEATIKAYRVFTVGQMEIWMRNCTLEEFESRSTAQRLVFKYEREIPAEGFRESGLHMLSENLDEQRFERIKPEIQSFNRFYKNADDGDIYTLDFVPSKGLIMRLNNAVLGTLGSSDIAQDYKKIWFGKNPFNDKLKRQLLSQLK